VAKLKRLQDVKSQAEIEAQKVMIAYKDKDISKDQPHLIEVDTKRASLRIIGHADAGKSSVCGNMMHLNGSKDSQRWPTWAPKWSAEAGESPTGDQKRSQTSRYRAVARRAVLLPSVRKGTPDIFKVASRAQTIKVCFLIYV